ncbi:MAG: UDP-glucuronic acid dehydrogenase, partial [Micavibrio sp.]|nr:UDP-glucuronic acid dehydrogenase [Micavibrio sp.]
ACRPTLKASNTTHDIRITTKRSELDGGDFLFLVSCTEMIPATIRDLYKHTLVVHASDLPKGKGWSPHIWAVLRGSNTITVSLFEAADKVDAGPIWKKLSIPLEGHELYDEINNRLFETTLNLMDYAIENPGLEPQPQNPSEESFYKKRNPSDSQIDPEKTIAAQFNLLRVCDPDRFPAFFDYAGCRYRIIIEKVDTED